MPTPQNPGPQNSQAPYPPPSYPPPPNGAPPDHQLPNGRPPIDPKASTDRLREQLRLFLILILALVIVSQLALPFRLAGGVLALWALWTGIRLLALIIRRRRAGLGAQGWVVVVVGLGLTGALLLMLVAEAAYYPLVSDLERCSAQANTRTAQDACDQASKERLDRLVNRLNGDAGHN